MTLLRNWQLSLLMHEGLFIRSCNLNREKEIPPEQAERQCVRFYELILEICEHLVDNGLEPTFEEQIQHMFGRQGVFPSTRIRRHD